MKIPSDFDLGKVQDSANEFVLKCIENFGSMNKNNYEVDIFHLLLLECFKDKNDFQISREMGIPESKVKRLRYEVNLVYKEDDAALRLKFLNMLFDDKKQYKIAGDRIQFVVNDKMLRLYLCNRLEEMGSFADSSWNSNIVSVTAYDLILLINNDASKDYVLNQVKEKLKEQNMSLAECKDDGKTDFLYGVCEAAIQDIVTYGVAQKHILAPNCLKFMTKYVMSNVIKMIKGA